MPLTVKYSVPIIKASDIRVSEKFYCSVLGFQKRGEYLSTPDGPAYMTISHGSALLHLSSFTGDSAYGTAVSG